MLDENRVIKRLAMGDTSAIEDLVNEFEASVYQYCLHFLGNERDAETAATDVFLRLVAQMGPDAKETSLKEWTMRIAVNVCQDHQQRRHRSKLREDADLEQYIHICLQRLMRQQRSIILLRDLIGLEQSEISSILEIDEHAVTQRLSRARRNLCDFLLQAGAPLDGSARRKRTKDNQHYHELCSRYVDEAVTKEEKTELLNHIQECELCAAYLQNLTKVGRELEHMMESSMPDSLKETIIQAVQLQAEKARLGMRRKMQLPLFTLVAGAAVFVILICSGTFGGLFANTNDAYADETLPGSVLSAVPQGIQFDNVNLPEKVAANSYAFAIAAVGGNGLPEMSTEAELIAVDAETNDAFYMVNSDVAAAQRLAQILESVGYTTDSIYDSRIKLSGDAPHGLIVVMGSETE